MRNSRLIGGKPKIGIRPIIDGRRGGIRESLEDMTMGMAHKVAELYSSVLRHSDGTSVECVIADTTIGGVAEAAMAAEKFRNSGVGVVLSVTPCWCYGFETIDMDGEMPKAIWGFNGTERPGAVYLASALASHTQKGLPTFGIYGRDVQDITPIPASTISLISLYTSTFAPISIPRVGSSKTIILAFDANHLAITTFC